MRKSTRRKFRFACVVCGRGYRELNRARGCCNKKRSEILSPTKVKWNIKPPGEDVEKA